MKIEILRGVVIDGKTTKNGDKVETSTVLAKSLIGKGKAKQVIARKTKKDD